MKKLALFVLLLLFISGCESKPQVKYNPPMDLTYDIDNEVITWTNMDTSTGYVLSINDELYSLTSNTFDFSYFPSGTYEIKVKALYGENESRFTYPLAVTLVKVTKLSVTIDDVITVSESVGATYYEFSVKNALNEEIFRQNSAIRVLDISAYSGILKIDIKAGFNTFETGYLSFYLDTNGYTYQKDTDDLVIPVNIELSGVSLDGTIVQDDNYIYSNQSLMISSLLLDTLADGSYLVKLSSSTPYYTYLYVTSVLKPKITSESIVTYNNTDLVFTFELNGGSFDGLSAQPMIGSTDYTFQGNTLTIHQSFIDQIKLDNPARTSIIFAYVISNGPYTIIGYLTINLN